MELPRVIAKTVPAADKPGTGSKRAEPAGPFFEAASWPGFLTGLVVALAIGAGIYVSLIGG